MLALDHSGNLFSWGCCQQRQLGRRLVSRMELHGLTPSRIGWSRKRFTYIACGADHSFAIDEQGLLYSWGLNNFGQTGIPCEDAESESIVEKPTLVISLNDHALGDVDGGTHHSIARTTDGKILVWGRCDDGQLGVRIEDVDPKHLIFDSRGKSRIMSRPVVFESMYHLSKETGDYTDAKPADIRASAVAAGVDNSMAISQEGIAYAWGFSANYRTGLGTEEPIEVATPLRNKALEGKRLSFGACGGQFSVLAGPAVFGQEDIGLTNGV